MRRPIGSEGFTWIEVVVILVVLGFVFVILSPGYRRERRTSLMVACHDQLSNIGKAMLVYANDYEDKLPRAGGPNTEWAPTIPNWRATTRRDAFGLASDGTGGQASVSASLYLLVKYAQVTPKSFVCKGDVGTTEFTLYDQASIPSGTELIDAWDFGPLEESSKHCSYAYHMPYGPFALTISNRPGMAVAADRNPWIDSPSGQGADFSRFKPDIAPFNGASHQARRGNAMTHQLDGQNVVFLDTHVEFAKHAYCALDDDNIYTISTSPTAGDPLGTPPKLGSQPSSRKDSLLVNDPRPLAGQK